MLVFRLLGSLEVEREGQPVEVSGQKQRAVLAILLLRAGEVVSSERLITELWGESPPPTAATALQNAISQLRKALGAEAVVTRTPGYVLAVEKEQIDVHRFEGLIESSRGTRTARALAAGAGSPPALAGPASRRFHLRRLCAR